MSPTIRVFHIRVWFTIHLQLHTQEFHEHIQKQDFKEKLDTYIKALNALIQSHGSHTKTTPNSKNKQPSPSLKHRLQFLHKQKQQINDDIKKIQI